MKLQRHKLKFVNSLFEEQPELLDIVLSTDITDENKDFLETQDDANKMRDLYVGCGCQTGRFYWQREDIKGNDIEIFACDPCGKWSMSVTY